MRRHSTDLVSLVAGVLFTALGVVFLLGELRGLTVEARWVLPVVLVGLGLCGLAATLRSWGRGEETWRQFGAAAAAVRADADASRDEATERELWDRTTTDGLGT